MNEEFQWQCHPEAEQLLIENLNGFVEANKTLSRLKDDLYRLTSTRLFDWIDHLILRDQGNIQTRMKELGFVLSQEGVFYHPGAQFPRIVLRKDPNQPIGVAVLVDSIDNFLMVHGGTTQSIEGSFFGGYRRSCFALEKGVGLWVVERRGNLALEPTQESPEEILLFCKALERWATSPRDQLDEAAGLEERIKLAEELVNSVGRDRAAWTVLEVERKYWQSKNRAGQLQKNRQDRVGMGWANHDHHTFRSSRKNFHRLVHLFEILGFKCRERFYAGSEAGWGAQVMENPNCRLVLFLDVDLSAEELFGDFAHFPLPELPQLGTIGLWCALHGDSILKSGMHHLEAQFMFEELSSDLADVGVKMMHPFSDFSYLKQAFTTGEIWSVPLARVEKLLKQGKITEDQAKKFLKEGALGSHLENLQRREGFKGFNQTNVSQIIKKTDPRAQA